MLGGPQAEQQRLACVAKSKHSCSGWGEARCGAPAGTEASRGAVPVPVAVVGAGAAAATSREAAARVGVPHQRLEMRDEVQETTRGERVARGELQPELGWLGLPHAACENLRERWGRCRGM